MVPQRVLEAVKARDLRFRAFALLMFILGAVDFRSGRLTVTLRALADGCGWDLSLDWLRKTLGELRAQGWIDYESRPGQQRPYVITLRAAAVTSDTPSATRTRSTSEATSESPRGGEPATARRDRPDGTSGPQSEHRPKSEEIEDRRPRRERTDDDDLAELLDSMGVFTPAQRDRIASAWHTHPDGVLACAEQAAFAANPAAMFFTLVKYGAYVGLADAEADDDAPF